MDERKELGLGGLSTEADLKSAPTGILVPAAQRQLRFEMKSSSDGKVWILILVVREVL